MRVLRGNDILINWSIYLDTGGLKTNVDFSNAKLSVFILDSYGKREAEFNVIGNRISIHLGGEIQRLGFVGLDAYWQDNTTLTWSRAKKNDVVELVDNPESVSFENIPSGVDIITIGTSSDSFFGGTYAANFSNYYTKSEIDKKIIDDYNQLTNKPLLYNSSTGKYEATKEINAFAGLSTGTFKAGISGAMLDVSGNGEVGTLIVRNKIILNGVELGTGSGSGGDLSPELTWLLNCFAYDKDTHAIYLKTVPKPDNVDTTAYPLGFYSNSFISARGAGSSSGGGGGGMDEDLLWSILANNGVEQIAKNHIIGALSDYATIDSVKTINDNLSALNNRLTNHIIDEDIHLTPEYRTKLNKLLSWFDEDDNKDIHTKSYVDIEGNTKYRGFYSHSFISAKGRDTTGGGSSAEFNEELMWAILGNTGNEQIAKNHLLDALSSYATIKYVDTIEDTINKSVTNLSNSFIAHADNENIHVTLSDKERLNKLFSWFDEDSNGNIHTKDYNVGEEIKHRGFYSNSFISAKGSGTGTSGGDFNEELMWAILANNGVEQIAKNHILDALNGYATEAWVNNQKFLKQNDLSIYATESWVNDQGFLKANSLNGYATEVWVTSNYVSKIDFNAALDLKLDASIFNDLFEKVNIGTTQSPVYAIKAKYGFYSNSFISAKGIGSDNTGGGLNEELLWAILGNSGTEQIAKNHLLDALSGYATQIWVSTQGFLKQNDLDIYATQSWVNDQGFLKLTNLAGYATEVWVSKQGFLKESNLTPYATIIYVNGLRDVLQSNINSLSQRVTDHINNKEVHITTEERNLIKKFASWFEEDENKHIHTKDYTNADNTIGHRGFYSSSFISAKGAEDNSSGGDGLDEALLWAILSNNGNEQIAKNHIINALDGYATKTWTNEQGFLKQNDLSVYATQSWVNEQSFLKEDSLVGYATQSWVNTQKFLKAADLVGYATEKWVTDKSYATNTKVNDINTTLTASIDTTNTNLTTLKTAYDTHAANKIVHITATERTNWNKAITDLSSHVSDTVKHITTAERTLWNKVASYFAEDTTNKGIYITNDRGFYTNSYISAKGSNSSGGGSGAIDEALLWSILANNGTEQIAKNHILDALLGYATITWVNSNFTTITKYNALDTRLTATEDDLKATTNKLNDFLQSEDINGTINKWKELESFLEGFTDTQTLAELLSLKADKTISINTGTGLTGGGTLAANRTISLNMASASALGGIKIGTTLAIAADGILNQKTIGTAGTYSKVTVDAYGRVTASSSLIASDIPTLEISKINGLQTAINGKANINGDNATGTWDINVSGYAMFLQSVSAGQFDCNAPTNTMYFDYGSANRDIKNAPSGWNYGGLLTLVRDYAFGNSLHLQLMWDVEHSSTTGSGQLWFRTKSSNNGYRTWAKLLDTTNYSALLDSRYVNKTGDTMTGTLIVQDGNGPTKGIQTTINNGLIMYNGVTSTYISQAIGTTYIRSGATDLQHTYNGTNYTILDVRNYATTLDTRYLTKATFDDLFEKVNTGTSAAPKWAIRAKYGFYSDYFVSAKGAGTSGGGSGNLDEELLWAILGNNGNEQINVSHLTGVVKKAGDTMTGALIINNDKIENRIGTGSFYSKNTSASSGGWARGLVFLSSAGNSIGSFGAYATGDTLNTLYVGTAWETANSWQLWNQYYSRINVKLEVYDKVTITTDIYGNQLEIKRAANAGNSVIRYSNLDSILGDIGICGSNGAFPNDLYFNKNGVGEFRIWHSGNDGTGSGLDADLLDGFQRTRYGGGISAIALGTSGKEYTYREFIAAGTDMNFATYGRRGTWDYSNNGYITTNFGNLALAGLSSLSFGTSGNNTTLFITANTSSGTPTAMLGEMLFHIDNGDVYVPTWRRVLTNYNYNSYALPLTGGTMTGTLIVQDGNGPTKGIQTTINNGLIMYNGVTSTYISQAIGTTYIRSGATDLQHTYNGTNYIILDARNYNGYAPSLNGIGANGTWGINITGRSDSTNRVLINNTEVKNEARFQYLQMNASSTIMPDSGWWSLLRSQHGGYTNGYWQEIAQSFAGDVVKYRRNINGTISAWKTFAWLDSNVESATQLETARSIFGRMFNGTANVAGQAFVYGTKVTAGQSYANGGIQIREAGMVGSAQTDDLYAPRIGFHWASRIGASIILNSTGFKFQNQNETSYANIYAGVVNADLIGNASTATALNVPRSIWGQNFNGTANVDGRIINTGGINVRIGSTDEWTNATIFSAGQYPLCMYYPDGNGNTRKYYYSGDTNSLKFNSLNDANTYVASIATYYHTGGVTWHGPATFNSSIYAAGNIRGAALTLAGSISGVTTIDASSTIYCGGTITMDGAGDSSLIGKNSTVLQGTLRFATGNTILSTESGNIIFRPKGNASEVNQNFISPSGYLYTNMLLSNGEITGNDRRFNECLAYYDNTAAIVTGTICITLPNGWNNSMNIYEIYVYEYSGVGASIITIGGYNYSANTAWYNYNHHTKGNYNKGVRVGYNGSKCVILLGTTTTTWAYPKVYLKTVLTGYSNQTLWSNGYSISLLTSESGYSSIQTSNKSEERFGKVWAGEFVGSLTGNADSATKLETARTLWGQSFNGTANISGNIVNTGHILPATHNTYNLGTASNRYDTGYFSSWLYSSVGLYLDGPAVTRVATNYLELSNAGNEMVIASTTTDLHINYRAPGYNSRKAPTTWYWRAGSSSSFADFNLGDVNANGNVSAVGYYILGTIPTVADNWTNVLQTRAGFHVSTEQSVAANSSQLVLGWQNVITSVGYRTTYRIYSWRGTSGSGSMRFAVGSNDSQTVGQFLDLNGSGEARWTGNFRADGQLKSVDNGFTSTFGAQNTNHCHIYTTAPSFYMDKGLSALTLTSRGALNTGGNISANGSLSGWSIELSSATPFIDFHFGSSTADYTSRLYESASGRLSITGKLSVNGYVNDSYGLATGGLISNTWIRTTGNYGWYSETHGGGIYMTDVTYVQVYGSKNFKINSGTFYALHIGSGSVYRAGYSGTTWGNGPGTINTIIANNSSQTPLIVASRNDAALTTGDANRLFSMELLNSGTTLRFNFKNALRFNFNEDGDLTAQGNIHTVGNVTANGGITAKVPSDRNLKNINYNKVDYTEKLLKLGEIREFTYNNTALNRTESYADRYQHTGLIYQDACNANITGLCLPKDKDGYGSVNYLTSDLMATVIGAVQLNILAIRNHESRLDKLERENRELRNEIIELKNKLNYGK